MRPGSQSGTIHGRNRSWCRQHPELAIEPGVARIIPEAISLQERIEALRRAGTIAWSGRRLRPAKPAGKARGDRTVADLVVENRE